MAAAEREGLCQPEHLHLFVLWYAFGGMQRGLTPLELATMPEALTKDFLYLLKRLERIRERQRVDTAT